MYNIVPIFAQVKQLIGYKKDITKDKVKTRPIIDVPQPPLSNIRARNTGGIENLPRVKSDICCNQFIRSKVLSSLIHNQNPNRNPNPNKDSYSYSYSYSYPYPTQLLKRVPSKDIGSPEINNNNGLSKISVAIISQGSVSAKIFYYLNKL